MRILLDAEVMQRPFTGIARVTLGLYEACARERPALDVTALHRKALAAPLPSRIRAVQAASVVPAALWRAAVLPVAISASGAAIAHFPWNGHVPPLAGGARVVTTLHDVLPLEIPSFFSSERQEAHYRKRVQRDIDRTHLLLTDSVYSRQAILAQFQLEREPLVIYPGPTLDEPASLPSPASQQDRYFVYVGGYDPRKGLVPLLRSFLALRRDDRVSGRLVLTGSQEYFSTEFKTLVADGCYMGVVEERGYVTDAELAELLARATALVYPSRYEGFGLPVLEAMAMGCPVITTRCTSIPEVSAEAACYIEPDDEQSIATALERLERDDAYRASLSRLGRERAAMFSWDQSARRYLDALDTIVVDRKS